MTVINSPRPRDRIAHAAPPAAAVPAKITNVAITAQYQRAGDTSSPVTMANDAATDT